MAQRTTKAAGRRELEELIQTCVSIENRQFNPFLLDISEALRILRRHAAEWKTLQDNLLDMRAITSLARVVGLQSANLRFQSSSLFVDPAMVRQKVGAMSREQLAEFFLLSWHPVVELEQLTEASTKEALEYWQKMLSFFERRKRLQAGPFDAPGAMDTPELARMRVHEERAFSQRLEQLRIEMKEAAGEEGRIEYWKFVSADTFASTVLRAQMVSFLVSYGMAMLERKREKMMLIPRDPPFAGSQGSPLSFPIPITQEAVVSRAK
ncbi:hypothetical protein J2P12_00970 [Candidatus Bathyarchaeota archaeon]|nr:hypothetical protein [Candidatus Bathyarchaeota archaeon]